MSKSSSGALTLLRRVVKSPVTRLVLFVVIIAGITMLVRGNMDFVSQAKNYFRHADPLWLLAAAGAIALSVSAMSEMMICILKSVDVRPKRRSVYALTLTCNSVALTFPGGTPISVAMGFREQLKWGASSVVASWYAVVSGVIATAGLASFGVVAVFALGAQINPWFLSFSLVGLIAVLVAIRWATKRAHRIEGLVVRVIGSFNRRFNRPEDQGIAQARDVLATLRTVELPVPRVLLAFCFSLLNWGADLLCLMFCLWAVGVHPSIASVMLAFVTAKIVGTAQVTPGGLGPVEATIVGTLVATGLSSASALAATVLFRVISFLLLAVVGWIVFFVQYASKASRDAILRADLPSEE